MFSSVLCLIQTSITGSIGRSEETKCVGTGYIVLLPQKTVERISYLEHI